MMTLAAWSQVKISCGPYLQAVGENEFTVVWMSRSDAVGWVELAPDDGTHFYATDRRKYHQVVWGRQPIGTLHCVRVSGLDAGTTYRYRVMQRGVVRNEGTSRVLFDEGYGTDVQKSGGFKVRTLDSHKERVKFAVGNDFHGHDSVFSALFSGVVKGGYDFVCLNGDMTSYIDSEQMIVDGYLKSVSERFASTVPMFMVRGNHEYRGTHALNYMNYYPSPSGAPYYAFRHGPVFFIMLDGGEDKPDNDIRNMGLMFTDQFRQSEAEWLAEVVESDECRQAPVKIVFCHMPPDSKSWHGSAEVSRLFVPLLNAAGIDVMFSGHIHRYDLRKAGTDGCDFPVVCNPNQARMDVTVDKDGIGVEIYDNRSQLVQKFSLPVHK